MGDHLQEAEGPSRAATWRYKRRGAAHFLNPSRFILSPLFPHPHPHNAIAKMASEASSHALAFWLSYSPAEQESFEDVLDLLHNVVRGKPGFFAGETVRDGQTVVDMVVCTPTRQRVDGVCGDSKWKRKGAKGRVCDARWPAPRQPVDVFLRKWAGAMTAAWNKTAGSREDLFRVANRFRKKDAGRKRDVRSRRKRLCSEATAGVSTSSVEEAQGLSLETPVQVDGVDPTLVCQPGDFAGIDFGPPAPCWCPFLQSPVALPFLRWETAWRLTMLFTGPDPPPDVAFVDILNVVLEQHGIPLSETSVRDFGCDPDPGWSCTAEALSLDVSFDGRDWKDPLDVFDLVL